jgi:hypothetical protein
MNISNHSTHSTQSDHYRALASEAMNSAAKTRFPVMRDGFLKLAASWIDLAAETEFVKH